MRPGILLFNNRNRKQCENSEKTYKKVVDKKACYGNYTNKRVGTKGNNKREDAVRYDTGTNWPTSRPGSRNRNYEMYSLQ